MKSKQLKQELKAIETKTAKTRTEKIETKTAKTRTEKRLEPKQLKQELKRDWNQNS